MILNYGALSTTRKRIITLVYTRQMEKPFANPPVIGSKDVEWLQQAGWLMFSKGALMLTYDARECYLTYINKQHKRKTSGYIAKMQAAQEMARRARG
jgi:hypothetical protein